MQTEILHAKFVGYASSEVCAAPADDWAPTATPRSFFARLAALHPRKKRTLALFLLTVTAGVAALGQGAAVVLGA
jgi:hypothetical protein